MPRYSDCYPGCGGEDCPCCEIHVDHQAETRHNSYEPMGEDDYYGSYRAERYIADEESEDDDYDDAE